MGMDFAQLEGTFIQKSILFLWLDNSRVVNVVLWATLTSTGGGKLIGINMQLISLPVRIPLHSRMSSGQKKITNYQLVFSF